MTTLPETNRNDFLAETKESTTTVVHPRAFTLIELLTVIVIIVILAALLLPALGKARYRARNVICINNQKQIALGVTAYTSDNDTWYPGDTGAGNVNEKTLSDGTVVKQLFFYRSAPSMLIGGRGLNYSTRMRDYFGGTLTTSLVCSLAPEIYKKKGAVGYGNKPRDINTETAVTSYAHYYGRMGNYRARQLIETLRAGIRSGGWSGAITTPSSDSYWGSGDVFFSPYVEKGMLKVGGGQKFGVLKNGVVKAYYPEYDDAEHSLISSDVLWGWNDNWRWTHGTYGQSFTGTSYGPGFQYGEFITSSRTEVLSESLDYNYATADGAVHTIPGVKYRDPRVTLASGPKSQWTKAWVIPVPDN